MDGQKISRINRERLKGIRLLNMILKLTQNYDFIYAEKPITGNTPVFSGFAAECSENAVFREPERSVRYVYEYRKRRKTVFADHSAKNIEKLVFKDRI